MSASRLRAKRRRRFGLAGAPGAIPERGAGGNDIYWQTWLPDGAGAPRAAVVLAHGASEHSGRYAWTAEQLTARGYAIYALDHRGHGRSSGSRALIDRIDNAVADIRTVV